jgi:hypothetical protein
MNRIYSLCFVFTCLCGQLTGCGGSKTPEQASSGSQPNGKSPAAAAADPANDAIAKAAHGFLDAVLKGDAQRAGGQLSPAAMQRIVAKGEQFNPPGFAQASFRIGEIRRSSESQALVQCILSATSEAGPPRDEEMCCLMRRVENDWRVSGIAFSEGPNQPLTIMDFEAGTATRQPAPGNQASPAAPPMASRPSPPRTGAEPSSTVR